MPCATKAMHSLLGVSTTKPSRPMTKQSGLDPKLAAGWYHKGNSLKAFGKTAEANAAFAKARELGYID